MSHHTIIIGLLSVLFVFKRTRYAAFVYLVPYIVYMVLYLNGLIEKHYYHLTSSALNLFIFLFLFVGVKGIGLNNMLNLHKYTINQIVGLLSLLLIFVNLSGYIDWYYNPAYSAIIYNSDYRLIVVIQMALLYIGNMRNAWVDRASYKLGIVQLNHYDSCEAPFELHKKEER